MDNHQFRKTDRKKGRKEEGNYIKARKQKMALLTLYLSIITLNVSGLNSVIKRHRVVEWI